MCGCDASFYKFREALAYDLFVTKSVRTSCWCKDVSWTAGVPLSPHVHRKVLVRVHQFVIVKKTGFYRFQNNYLFFWLTAEGIFFSLWFVKCPFFFFSFPFFCVDQELGCPTRSFVSMQASFTWVSLHPFLGSHSNLFLLLWLPIFFQFVILKQA